jgi:hypothetical protein
VHVERERGRPLARVTVPSCVADGSADVYAVARIHERRPSGSRRARGSARR